MWGNFLYRAKSSFSGTMNVTKCNYWGSQLHQQSFEKYINSDLGEKALYVLGNHDTSVANFTAANNWTYNYTGVTKEESLETYYANIGEWGVTRPDPSVCYYYKDYASAKIRLIVLDVQYWDATELSWLETALTGAKTNEYGVVIAAHCIPGAITGYTGTNFTNYDDPDYSGDYSTTFGTYTPDAAVSVIQTFINNGGNFICWLCGHNHKDRFAKSNTCNDITVVQIENAGNFNASQHYADRTDINVYSETSANVITFNSTEKLIKIVRFGNNMDKYMRVKDYLCFDYENKQLIT